MFRIVLHIKKGNRGFRIGNVLIEGGAGGETEVQLPVMKNVWDNELKCFLVRWEMYDYQAFLGVYEVYDEEGDVKLYMVDSNPIFEAYKEGNPIVDLVEIDNITEYEKLLESYK